MEGLSHLIYAFFCDDSIDNICYTYGSRLEYWALQLNWWRGTLASLGWNDVARFGSEIQASLFFRTIIRRMLLSNPITQASTYTASTMVPGRLGTETARRRQFSSCDYCRKSRIACDASQLQRNQETTSGSPDADSSSSRVQCTNCSKRSLTCTYEVSLDNPLVANHRVAILMMMIHLSGFGIVETGM